MRRFFSSFFKEEPIRREPLIRSTPVIEQNKVKSFGRVKYRSHLVFNLNCNVFTWFLSDLDEADYRFVWYKIY